MIAVASKVTRNGQVTIPKKLREKQQLKEGSVVFFVEEAGQLVLKTAVEKSEDQDYLHFLDKQMAEWLDPVNDDLVSTD